MSTRTRMLPENNQEQHDKKHMSMTPLLVLTSMLLLVLGATGMPLASALSKSPRWIFFFYEASGIIIGLAKPQASTMGNIYAVLVYLGVENGAERRPEAVDENHTNEMIAGSKTELLARMKGFLDADTTSEQELFRLIKNQFSPHATCCSHFHNEPRDPAYNAEELLGKIRKCKPETILDAFDKTVRNTVILFHILFGLFSWKGGICAVLVVLGIIRCQMILDWAIKEQDRALSQVIKRLRNSAHETSQLVQDMSTLASWTRSLAIYRTVRDVVCFAIFFLAFQWTDNDNSLTLIALFKYFTSIRDSFDKLSSWRIQVTSIFARGNGKIARAALQIWWDLLSKRERVKTLQIMNGISPKPPLGASTGYHTFDKGPSCNCPSRAPLAEEC